MKKYVKFLFVLLILCMSISLITGCNGNSTSANNKESLGFLEVGEKYIITGVFKDNSYGVNVDGAAVEVLEINNNWIKVKNVETMYNEEDDYRVSLSMSTRLFSEMEDDRFEWDYFWINLDNVLGIVK